MFTHERWHKVSRKANNMGEVNDETRLINVKEKLVEIKDFYANKLGCEVTWKYILSFDAHANHVVEISFCSPIIQGDNR
jgi:hypothetical protein